MDHLIYSTAALLLISKFLDCYSTQVEIGENIENEKNPLARRFMKFIRINETIWLFFLIATVIICLSTFLILQMNPGLLYEAAFIIIGLIISTIQFGVAHNNYYRKSNRITRLLTKFLQSFNGQTFIKK